MFVRNVLTPRSTVLANAIQCLILNHIINVATRMSLSLFCLMYLTFAKGNEAFNRRVSRFVYPVMEISESGTRVPGDIAARQNAIRYCRQNERKAIQW